MWDMQLSLKENYAELLFSFLPMIIFGLFTGKRVREIAPLDLAAHVVRKLRISPRLSLYEDDDMTARQIE